ncbi:MAG: hypothetical protein OHK0053_01230 [Microscillaceae bacterium]
MEIKEWEEEGYFGIEIYGDLDAASSIELDKTLEKVLKKETKALLIDCQHLHYIASAGLGVFISYIEPFQEKSVFFCLYGLNDRVRDVFQILGLDKLLVIVDTKEDAKKRKNDSLL